MSAVASPAIAENPWLAQCVRIERITREVPGVATYHLRFRDDALHRRYRFQPGQFNMLYLPGVGEIAISISGGGNETETTWDHTVRLAGSVTGTLARLGVGATLGMRGPYGSSWPIDACQGADVVIVAGGIGLPPLRPVIEHLRTCRDRVGRLTLLYGARSPDGLLYTRQYDAWRSARIDVQTTVDRAAPAWTGDVGVVPLLVDRLQSLRPADSVFMLCGPEVMIRYSVRAALARGIRKDQVWVSLERNMQCAVGLCGHCQLGSTFVCKDGPVYRYDAIEPYLDVEAL
jgi:NAD(P)H-flavin reductase